MNMSMLMNKSIAYVSKRVHDATLAYEKEKKLYDNAVLAMHENTSIGNMQAELHRDNALLISELKITIQKCYDELEDWSGMHFCMRSGHEKILCKLFVASPMTSSYHKDLADLIEMYSVIVTDEPRWESLDSCVEKLNMNFDIYLVNEEIHIPVHEHFSIESMISVMQDCTGIFLQGVEYSITDKRGVPYALFTININDELNLNLM